jgi:hypothetical protein
VRLTGVRAVPASLFPAARGSEAFPPRPLAAERPRATSPTGCFRWDSTWSLRDHSRRTRRVLSAPRLRPGHVYPNNRRSPDRNGSVIPRSWGRTCLIVPAIHIGLGRSFSIVYAWAMYEMQLSVRSSGSIDYEGSFDASAASRHSSSRTWSLSLSWHPIAQRWNSPCIKQPSAGMFKTLHARQRSAFSGTSTLLEQK